MILIKLGSKTPLHKLRPVVCSHCSCIKQKELEMVRNLGRDSSTKQH